MSPKLATKAVYKVQRQMIGPDKDWEGVLPDMDYKRCRTMMAHRARRLQTERTACALRK